MLKKVDMNMKIFTGKLQYRNKDFIFVFDGESLKLIPEDQEILFSWTHKELIKGVYSFPVPIAIEEKIIIGHINENNRKIIFIMAMGRTFSQENNTISIKPLAYIEVKHECKMIDRVSFTCPELDLIFPVRNAYQISLSNEAIENGTYSIESRAFKDHTSQKAYFTYKNKEIKSYFSISKSLHISNRTPIEFVSTLFFDFDGNKDYLFLYELAVLARQFVQFLSNRQNIQFEAIDLSTSNKEGKHERFAEMTILEKFEKDDFEIIKNRIIPFSDFSGFEGNVFQMIADETLYFRHLSESFRKGRIINAATFVMITAAFEWEFRKLFPNGVEKEEKRIKAENNVCNYFDELIKEKTGEEKKILKYLQKLVGNDNLASEIIYVCNQLNNIIDIFGKYIYSINGEELIYSEMGERVARQRNNFAHGNLDKEFEGTALLDIMFLQIIVYAMQLKRSKIPDSQIRDAINSLFHLSLYIEQTK